MPAETAGDRGSDPLAGACVSDTGNIKGLQVQPFSLYYFSIAK